MKDVLAFVARFLHALRGKEMDREAIAVEMLTIALAPLGQGARARVLQYAWSRFVELPLRDEVQASAIERVRKGAN